MKVSVAMCTYNGEKYIREQLESILAQTQIPDEIVICDDCSSDDTVAIAQEVLRFITPPRIKYRIIINEKNKGYIRNFEQCALQCSGDIVFFSDQDDVWLEQKIERMIQEFEHNPNCVLCYSDAIVTDSDLKLKDASLNTGAGIALDDFVARSIEGKFAYGCTMAVRKETLMKIMPFRFGHDHYVSMCAPLLGDVVEIKEPMILYRRHDTAVTGNVSKKKTERIVQRTKKFWRHVRERNKEKWFIWPSLVAEGYGEYLDRFGERLKEKAPEAHERLMERIEFARALKCVIGQRRFRAMLTLIQLYLQGKYRIRGNRNTLLLDLLYILLY